MKEVKEVKEVQKEVILDEKVIGSILSKYNEQNEKEKKAVLGKKALVQKLVDEVPFEWYLMTPEPISKKSNLIDIMKDNYVVGYVAEHADLMHFKMDNIEYNFEVSDIFEDDTKKLQAKYPNSEGYAYLVKAGGCRRSFTSAFNHHFNAMKKIAKNLMTDDDDNDEGDNLDKQSLEYIDNKITQDCNERITTLQNRSTGSKWYSEQQASLRISILEKTKKSIGALKS